jgi:membrane-bound metal-dependent hydrolase YbcI (DUF457 family)
MMGKSHAAMGLAVGAGIGVAVFGLSSPTWLIPTVAVCGAAILPDIDEPGSTVSREFGLVSAGFSFLVNKIAGGHRKLTHSLLGVGIILVLLWLFSTSKEGSAVLFGLLAASAWRIVFPWWLRLGRLFILAGVGAGILFYHADLISGLWLVALVGVGWLVHMTGDFLTRGGIPLLYPKAEEFSLSVFGTTGSKLETLFAAILYLSVFITLGLWFSHYSQGAQFTHFVSTRLGR